MNTALQLMPLILLIFIMYFLLIRPQKKREKETTNMRNNLQVGDEVITIGGVCGKIVKVKEESLIIQVGAEKVKFEVMRWAISKIVSSDASAYKKTKTAYDDVAEEAPKKVFPKKMGKKPEESVVEAPQEESIVETPQEEIIDIPEEDVKVLGDEKQ